MGWVQCFRWDPSLGLRASGPRWGFRNGFQSKLSSLCSSGTQTTAFPAGVGGPVSSWEAAHQPSPHRSVPVGLTWRCAALWPDGIHTGGQRVSGTFNHSGTIDSVSVIFTAHYAPTPATSASAKPDTYETDVVFVGRCTATLAHARQADVVCDKLLVSEQRQVT